MTDPKTMGVAVTALVVAGGSALWTKKGLNELDTRVDDLEKKLAVLVTEIKKKDDEILSLKKDMKDAVSREVKAALTSIFSHRPRAIPPPHQEEVCTPGSLCSHNHQRIGTSPPTRAEGEAYYTHPSLITYPHTATGGDIPASKDDVDDPEEMRRYLQTVRRVPTTASGSQGRT